MPCPRLAGALALAGLWAFSPSGPDAANGRSDAVIPVETLRATAALPAHIADAFESPRNFEQTDAGEYFVFDRRGHAVYTVSGDTARKIIEIGAEPGRILDPSAFDMDPRDGTFVVADAPNQRERIQVFTAAGSRLSGFTLPGRELPRITFDTFVLNGVGTLQFTGNRLLLNQPERGALITEMMIDGTPVRTFGRLRPTGHEGDPGVHTAFNSGFPLVDPAGGYYFVFAAGPPMFRKYDATGELLFERHIEGPEIDEYLRALPTTWTRQKQPDGTLIPLVNPAVRAAGVDRQGRLWVSLIQPMTYVYDRTGDKIHTVQFRGADIIAPNSLFFTRDGRVLVTPGCYEFSIKSVNP
jgi:hypothetical protein